MRNCNLELIFLFLLRHEGGGGGCGGYSDIFIINIGLALFLGSNFFFFRKMNIFWGMKILQIFLGHIKNGLFCGVFSIQFRVCSCSHCTRWEYFLRVVKI